MSEVSYTVAVVGAAGMVGSEMIRLLEQRAFPVKDLRPLDLASVAGTEIEFDGEPYIISEATEAEFAGVDIAFFSAGNPASLDLAPKAVRQGAVVIDNSSAWRMDPNCPLVVPEVNPHDLAWHHGIIANPNCSTIQMVVVLKPLHDFARIRRVVVATYQAASGAGRAGGEELRSRRARLAVTSRSYRRTSSATKSLSTSFPRSTSSGKPTTPKKNGRWSMRRPRSWATLPSAFPPRRFAYR